MKTEHHTKESLVDYDSETGRMRNGPRQIFLELSSKCNLTCIHCPTDFGAQGGPARKFLPLETITKLEPWLHDAHFLNLNGVGESLLSPHFEATLALLEPMKAEVSFNTNGTLLTPKRCEAIVKSRVHSVSVSVDGTRSNEAIRGIPYHKVKEGIRNLHQAKLALRSELPHIGLAYVLMRRNAFELPKVIRDITSSATIHAVHVQPLVIFYEALRNENIYKYDVAADAIEEARDVARKSQTLFSLFRSSGDQDERERNDRELAQLGPSSKEYGCIDPFFEIKIRATGDVMACSFGLRPDLNVSTVENLDEIWNHSWYRDLRRTLSAGQFLGACERCPCIHGSAAHQESPLRQGVRHSQEDRFFRGGYGQRTSAPTASREFRFRPERD